MSRRECPGVIHKVYADLPLYAFREVTYDHTFAGGRYSGRCSICSTRLYHRRTDEKASA